MKQKKHIANSISSLNTTTSKKQSPEKTNNDTIK